MLFKLLSKEYFQDHLEIIWLELLTHFDSQSVEGLCFHFCWKITVCRLVCSLLERLMVGMCKVHIIDVWHYSMTNIISLFHSSDFFSGFPLYDVVRLSCLWCVWKGHGYHGWWKCIFINILIISNSKGQRKVSAKKYMLHLYTFRSSNLYVFP